MPAIRYQYQCLLRTVDNTGGKDPVEVRLKSGDYKRIKWLGMVCESATDMIHGLGFVKIKAFEVTNGDGVNKCEWRRLLDSEHVQGWRCETNNGAEGVYGVIDRNGWPIIVGTHGRKAAPRLKVVNR